MLKAQTARRGKKAGLSSARLYGAPASDRDPALNPQAKFVNAKFGPKDYQQSDKARRGGLVVPAGPRRPPPG